MKKITIAIFLLGMTLATETYAPVSVTGVHDLSVSPVSGTNVELDWVTWK